MTIAEFLAAVSWATEEAPQIVALIEAAVSALEGKGQSATANAAAAVQAVTVAADAAEAAKFGPTT